MQSPTISEITKTHREEQGLTLEAFAAALCSDIPGIDLTKMAISTWETGKNVPGYAFTLLVFMRYHDWRSGWARDVLKVLKPSMYR